MAPRWLVLAFALPLTAAPPVVMYQVQARLDSAQKSVTGHEVLTWRNDSPDIVRELQFHLYLNAFQNEKSTFMRESGGQVRGDRAAREGWGYIEVRKLRVSNSA